MLPRVAFEYGHTPCAFSIRSSATLCSRPGQVANEVRVDAEAALGVLAEPDLRGDAGGVVEVDLLVARDQSKRAEEARGIARGEQLLGVGALAAAASSFGGRVSRSILPSVDFTWPSRPPPVAVDSAV